MALRRTISVEDPGGEDYLMGGTTVRFYTRRGAPELSDRDPETYPPEAVAVFDMSPACRSTARRSSCQLELARGTGRSRYHHRQTGGGRWRLGRGSLRPSTISRVTSAACSALMTTPNSGRWRGNMQLAGICPGIPKMHCWHSRR